MCDHNNIEKYNKIIPYYEEKYNSSKAICNICNNTVNGHHTYHCNDCHYYDLCGYCYNHKINKHRCKKRKRCFLCQKNECDHDLIKLENKDLVEQIFNEKFKFILRERLTHCNNCGETILESAYFYNGTTEDGMVNIDFIVNFFEDYFFICNNCQFICCVSCNIKNKKYYLFNNDDLVNI
jgi:hypothetical protein